MDPPVWQESPYSRDFLEQGSDSSKGSESLSPNTEQVSCSTIFSTKAADPLLLGGDHTPTIGVINAEEDATHDTDDDGQHKTCPDVGRKPKWKRIPRLNADGEKQNTRKDTPYISDSRKRELVEAVNSPMEIDDTENAKKQKGISTPMVTKLVKVAGVGTTQPREEQ